MQTSRYVVIMAGGVGSRFWPSSTEETPKQFLDILGVGKSLLRMTYERFCQIVPSDHIFIVTNRQYQALTAFHLPELPKENILLEPSRNNTAPCIAYAALRLKAIEPKATFVVAPSDHVILKEAAFKQKIEQAFSFAESTDALVTLGIVPSRPDTGYGYIETHCMCAGDAADPSVGVCDVSAFKEKPDFSTAQQYVSSGHYLWNAGIFVWSVSSILMAFEQHTEGILDVLTAQPDVYNSPNEQVFIDSYYPTTQRISIDYAILEKANNVYTIPADIGWSDLGTWNSLHAYLDKDENFTVSVGANIHLIDTKDSMIRSDSDKIVVIKGLSNYIVVDEPHALLIYPKSDEQEIKKVVQERVMNS